MGRKPLALFAAIVVFASACGGAAGPGTTEPDTGWGPDGVMFRIDSEGGFVPVEWVLGRGPVYTLTDDGGLISEGAVPAIFPGPLLPFYFVTQLTDGEMSQIRDMIDRMGLADMVSEHDDSNTNFVADVTTEVITYWDAAGTHEYAVYGLGFEAGGAKSTATRTFAEMRSVLDNIAGTRESTPYVAEKIRVIAGEGIANAEFTDLRDWPLPETDFSDWVAIDEQWDCKAFDATGLAAFEDATQVTTWSSPTAGQGPAELQLLVRPLQPGEDDCPSQFTLGG